MHGHQAQVGTKNAFAFHAAMPLALTKKLLNLTLAGKA